MDITDVLSLDFDKVSKEVRQLALTVIRRYESENGMNPYSYWDIFINKGGSGIHSEEGCSYNSSTLTDGTLMGIPSTSHIGGVLFDIYCESPESLTTTILPTTLQALIDGYGIPYGGVFSETLYILPKFNEITSGVYQIEYKIDKPILLGDNNLPMQYGVNTVSSLLPDSCYFHYSVFSVMGTGIIP